MLSRITFHENESAEASDELSTQKRRHKRREHRARTRGAKQALATLAAVERQLTIESELSNTEEATLRMQLRLRESLQTVGAAPSGDSTVCALSDSVSPRDVLSDWRRTLVQEQRGLAQRHRVVTDELDVAKRNAEEEKKIVSDSLETLQSVLLEIATWKTKNAQLVAAFSSPESSPRDRGARRRSRERGAHGVTRGGGWGAAPLLSDRSSRQRSGSGSPYSAARSIDSSSGGGGKWGLSVTSRDAPSSARSSSGRQTPRSRSGFGGPEMSSLSPPDSVERGSGLRSFSFTNNERSPRARYDRTRRQGTRRGEHRRSTSGSSTPRGASRTSHLATMRPFALSPSLWEASGLRQPAQTHSPSGPGREAIARSPLAAGASPSSSSTATRAFAKPALTIETRTTSGSNERGQQSLGSGSGDHATGRQSLATRALVSPQRGASGRARPAPNPLGFRASHDSSAQQPKSKQENEKEKEKDKATMAKTKKTKRTSSRSPWGRDDWSRTGLTSTALSSHGGSDTTAWSTDDDEDGAGTEDESFESSSSAGSGASKRSMRVAADGVPMRSGGAGSGRGSRGTSRSPRRSRSRSSETSVDSAPLILSPSGSVVSPMSSPLPASRTSPRQVVARSSSRDVGALSPTRRATARSGGRLLTPRGSASSNGTHGADTQVLALCFSSCMIDTPFIYQLGSSLYVCHI